MRALFALVLILALAGFGCNKTAPAPESAADAPELGDDTMDDAEGVYDPGESEAGGEDEVPLRDDEEAGDDEGDFDEGDDDFSEDEDEEF